MLATALAAIILLVRYLTHPPDVRHQASEVLELVQTSEYPQYQKIDPCRILEVADLQAHVALPSSHPTCPTLHVVISLPGRENMIASSNARAAARRACHNIPRGLPMMRPSSSLDAELDSVVTSRQPHALYGAKFIVDSINSKVLCASEKFFIKSAMDWTKSDQLSSRQQDVKEY